MSTEEQFAAEGRLRHASREAKRRVAALAAELSDCGRTFGRLAEHLKAVAERPAEGDDPLRAGEIEALLAKICEGAKLREALSELRRERENYAQLAAQLAQFE